MLQVLVTIPAFNEELRLESCVLALDAALFTSGLNYKVAIAEDGSTDGTPEVIHQLQQSYPNLVVASGRARKGRGLALRELWRTIDAQVYCFVDSDLPAGADAVSKIARAVLGGADVAIGSRYCKGAFVVRPPLVRFASESYNWVVRQIFGDEVMDHQSGLKAFSRAVVDRVIDQATDRSWFWDTEMIILAQRQGFEIAELPISWIETRYRRTSLRRLAREVPYFLAQILRLSATLSKEGGPSRGKRVRESRTPIGRY